MTHHPSTSHVTVSDPWPGTEPRWGTAPRPMAPEQYPGFPAATGSHPTQGTPRVKELAGSRYQPSELPIQPQSQPSYGQPSYGQPSYGQPSYGQPFYRQPQGSYGQSQVPYGQPQHPAGTHSVAPQPVGVPGAGWRVAQPDPAGVPGDSSPSSASGRPARPLALVAGVAAGLTSCALVVASQVMALLDGRAAIETTLADVLPGGIGKSSIVKGLISSAADDAYGTLVARAYLSIGLAGIAALLVLLSLRAVLGVRIAAVSVLVVTEMVTLVCLLDIFPDGARLVGAAGLALAPVCTVLLFLPSVFRYRRARQGAAA